MKATDHDGLWMADLTIRWLRSMVSSNTKLRYDTAEAHKSESASKKTFESDWKDEKAARNDFELVCDRSSSKLRSDF